MTKNRKFPTPLQQSVPGWTIFAMFFIAIPMSIGFLREKNDGTLQRIFTYPVNPNWVALGKVIPYYLINNLQFILMLLVGYYVMPNVVGIEFGLGEHPWHLVAVTLIAAAAATGFGVLIAAISRTPEQGSTLAATLSVLMGVFGGIMVPHVVMPLFMQKLAMISPMYWAHQAYLDVFFTRGALCRGSAQINRIGGFCRNVFLYSGKGEFNGFREGLQGTECFLQGRFDF